MGLNAAGWARFEATLNAALRALWPGTLTIGGTGYAAAVVPALDEAGYVEGGEIERRRRVFIISKTVLATRPAPNQVVTWTDAAGATEELVLAEVSDGDGEAAWRLVCEHKDR